LKEGASSLQAGAGAVKEDASSLQAAAGAVKEGGSSFQAAAGAVKAAVEASPRHTDATDARAHLSGPCPWSRPACPGLSLSVQVLERRCEKNRPNVLCDK
jgi:hypothetical protein